jgi:hypothetical protein
MFEIFLNLIYIERKLRVIRVIILTHFIGVQRNADMFYLKSVNSNLNFLQRILANFGINVEDLLKARGFDNVVVVWASHDFTLSWKSRSSMCLIVFHKGYFLHLTKK